jgi:endonuclease VIII
MPEGDSVHRHATQLRPHLVGKPLVAVYQRGLLVPRLAGASVTAIEPHGKHLLIETDHGVVAHIHLGMNGGWRRVRRPLADEWPIKRADLALVTAEDVLLCRARTVELVRAGFVKSHPALRALGPDLLGDSVDMDDIIARARRGDGRRPIADVLLDQQVAAGIGNIYKNETLFFEKTDPHAPVGELDDATLRRLYARARELLTMSVGGRRHRMWVYRRRGQPCHACRTAIAGELTMPLARQTFWCPKCQAAGSLLLS